MAIPQEIKGVTLSDQQYKDLVEGKPVKVEGMTSKNGKSFDATLQVNAEKKGIEFIFDNKGFKERQEQQQGQSQQGVPRKLCGLELSEAQREALNSGRTLYLKNMTNKEGQSFNAHVKLDKEQNRLRFYKYNPDKKQEASGESKKQVEQSKSTKQEQGENQQKKQNRKGRKM